MSGLRVIPEWFYFRGGVRGGRGGSLGCWPLRFVFGLFWRRLYSWPRRVRSRACCFFIRFWSKCSSKEAPLWLSPRRCSRGSRCRWSRGFCIFTFWSAFASRIPTCFGRGCSWEFQEACIRGSPWRIALNLWRGSCFRSRSTWPRGWSVRPGSTIIFSIWVECSMFWDRNGRCCGSWSERAPCRPRLLKISANFDPMPCDVSNLCTQSKS